MLFASEILTQLRPCPLMDWLNYFSVETWDRIEFGATQDRNRVFETTLTQNLVFNFHRIQKREKFPLKIYESGDERRNGNDLEFIFQIGDKWLHVPCQCKIVGRNSRYETIGHKSKNDKFQIDQLIEYANINSSIPIYLFYNFSNDYVITERIQAEWGFDVQQFGCSVIDANYIKEAYFTKNSFNESGHVHIPSFDDLHVRGRPADWSALPFFALSTFCTKRGIELFRKRYSKYLNFIDSPVDRHLKDTLDLTGWERIILSASIGRVTSSNQIKKVVSSNTEEIFSPAYRVLFLMEKLPSTLARLS